MVEERLNFWVSPHQDHKAPHEEKKGKNQLNPRCAIVDPLFSDLGFST